MTIPTTPGPITLAYPKWIPGQHSPVGLINDVVGLKCTIGGAAVPGQRDDVDMYAFHLQVPLGVSEIEAEFYLTGTSDESGHILGNSSAQLNYFRLARHRTRDATLVSGLGSKPPRLLSHLLHSCTRRA